MPLPVFGIFSRPRAVIFPQHCDMAVVQVGIQRPSAQDHGLFAYGIKAISLLISFKTPGISGNATQQITLNFTGGPSNQSATGFLSGPGATQVAYGVHPLTGAIVSKDWIWQQGPSCQFGVNSGGLTYDVRGYIMINLSLIKKLYPAGLIGFCDIQASFDGSSGSTYQMWVELLHHATAVNFGTLNSLVSLGGITMTKAANMGWAYKSMLSWAKGIGAPTGGGASTDHLTPTMTAAITLASSTYSTTITGSGFGGTLTNVLTATNGSGND